MYTRGPLPGQLKRHAISYRQESKIESIHVQCTYLQNDPLNVLQPAIRKSTRQDLLRLQSRGITLGLGMRTTLSLHVPCTNVQTYAPRPGRGVRRASERYRLDVWGRDTIRETYVDRVPYRLLLRWQARGARLATYTSQPLRLHKSVNHSTM